ncbi:GntR family transcriptional regulator [Citrobacter freundii]|uniref:GntR family transcriptional regulator n=1 Tax=Citrobacter freundii TaxID=546 RepID=UPI000C808EDF|nr:GntR family transcriptional regulator [Citrobacter freundii]EMB4337303.1 GntR family transcriptional regulator [Citrobacter freundii]MBJ9041949.1 GntR family transcriptional regulator [Citrobacter freundii]NTY76551.1 GntR family transcriptional regulator [Citrobacter freundii]NUA12999.1 GntR family transcriptional regulator [Citrobacter freundii]PMD03428.1 GntR family transcriptional regulator [Citrobacter freundii]
MTIINSQPQRPRKAYLEARKRLLAMLRSPEFNSGDQIPAERELSEQLGISRMTVRKIITELVEEGVLERRGNRGTWLMKIDIERPLAPTPEMGVSKIIELNGAVPSSQLIYFYTSQASARIARILHISEGDELVMIKRLRLADGQPFCIETSYLPRARVADLTAEMLESTGSLYRILAERYGIQCVFDDGTIRATTMSEEEHQLLQAKPESPALIYRGVIYDGARQPVEYLVSVNHPQRVAFKISGSLNEK